MHLFLQSRLHLHYSYFCDSLVLFIISDRSCNLNYFPDQRTEYAGDGEAWIIIGVDNGDRRRFQPAFSHPITPEYYACTRYLGTKQATS